MENAAQGQDKEITKEGIEKKSSEEIISILEEMQKIIEQVKRENQLFESYIARTEKSGPERTDQPEKKKDKKKDKEKKAVPLTAEEKHNIANQELQALKKDIEVGRNNTDQATDQLKAYLEETDMQISSIKKEAFEFKREIVTNGENERTGKVMAEKLEKYMEEMKRKKEDAISKLEKKNKLLLSKVAKSEQQLKAKEEMGDDLKFIDFHQLEIENKKHVKEIDEKNKKLLSLKISSGDTIESLNSYKKKLSEKEKELYDKKVLYQNSDKNLKDIKNSIKNTQLEFKKQDDIFRTLEQQFKSSNLHASEKDYIELKDKLLSKQKLLSELDRTVKIHKSLAKAAKKIIESQNN